MFDKIKSLFGRVSLNEDNVIKEIDKTGHVVYKKIEPTKTGNYMYYFNKWVKLSTPPQFSTDG